ncbi:Hypothetical predicted protein [Octopus vulgaris]|uniref:Uncharacterized protein n=1 Tax=Octopus vulgaris TaxID=6645 RepID=A0AA36BLZ2_OCTVU|nr:Hypothetical predicted protein [Octopus vulgaris]
MMAAQIEILRLKYNIFPSKPIYHQLFGLISNVLDLNNNNNNDDDDSDNLITNRIVSRRLEVEKESMFLAEVTIVTSLITDQRSLGAHLYQKQRRLRRQRQWRFHYQSYLSRKRQYLVMGGTSLITDQQ